jgi:UDP-2,3-diacylglucosamine hydrolase
VLGKEYFDYFIFGHRHLPIDYPLGNSGPGSAPTGSRYINLGDWIRYNTYAVFDGERLSLLTDTPGMADKIIRG